MIDLHLHTTASDGRSSPEQLVRTAAAAGVTTLAVTDHDTTAGVAAARAAAVAVGVQVVMGIEITAVLDGRDVHILGYFFDDTCPELVAFLAAQRDDRRRRVDAIVERLKALGAPVDSRAIARTGRGQSQGDWSAARLPGRSWRPAMRATWRTRSIDSWRTDVRRSFRRQGARPAEVIALIGARRRGGIVRASRQDGPGPRAARTCGSGPHRPRSVSSRPRC